MITKKLKDGNPIAVIAALLIKSLYLKIGIFDRSTCPKSIN